MIYFRSFIILVVFSVASCGGIEFIYKEQENLTNPIYNKAVVNLSGKEIPFAQRYISRYIGNESDKIYSLGISIAEDKIKRSVQSNQAVSKMDYNLEFFH